MSAGRWLRERLARFSGLAAPASTPLPAVPVAPDWTPVDQGHWQHFLASNTGKSLWARLRAVELVNALEAVQLSSNVDHSAGKAAGFVECRQYLESLSRTSCVTGDDRPPTEGESALLERISP